MTTYQLNGAFVSVSVTTTPALLNIPNGCNGIIVTNPDATNSIFIHLAPQGVAAPSAAENLRGIRVYPGTSFSLSILNEPPYGCNIYLASNAGTITAHAYGVI